MLFLSSLSNSQSIKKIFKDFKNDKIKEAYDELSKFDSDKHKYSSTEINLFLIAEAIIISDERCEEYEPYTELKLFEENIISEEDLPRVNEFLNKYDYTLNSISKILYTNILNFAKKKNTESEYKKALDVCIKCDYLPEIKDLLIESAYKESISDGKIGKLKYFLKEYPNSKYNNEIEKLIETNFYNRSIDIGTIDSFKDFIRRYPNSDRKKEIEQLLNSKAFEIAKTDLTIDSMRNYIKSYPKSDWIDQANKIINSLTLSLDQNINNKNVQELEKRIIVKKEFLTFSKNNEYKDFNCSFLPKNAISTNNSFFLLPYIDENIYKTDKIIKNNTVKINKFDKKNRIITFDLNNDFKDKNKIFSMFLSKGFYNFNQISVDEKNDSITDLTFSVPEQFEIKEKDIIETINVSKYAIGNGIGAFTGYSTFSNKAYLFLYDFSNDKKYTKIDLSNFSNSFKSVNKVIYFDGIINGKKLMGGCYLENVIKTDKFIYVFLNIYKDLILPIKIDHNNKATLMSNSIFTVKNNNCFAVSGIHFNESVYFCNDGYYNLPFSKGFVNYFMTSTWEEKITTLNFYDSNLNHIWDKSIEDIVINKITELDNYIIVGGYCFNKGYLGYPNPRILIINKLTKNVTYDKVIPMKNFVISSINFDDNKNVILGIGLIQNIHPSSDKDYVTEIIIDKLLPNGTFEKDLFENKN